MNVECTHECESCRLAKIEAKAVVALSALTDAADALAARMDRLEEAAMPARYSLSSNSRFDPYGRSSVEAYSDALRVWTSIR